MRKGERVRKEKGEKGERRETRSPRATRATRHAPRAPVFYFIRHPPSAHDQRAPTHHPHPKAFDVAGRGAGGVLGAAGGAGGGGMGARGCCRHLPRSDGLG